MSLARVTEIALAMNASVKDTLELQVKKSRKLDTDSKRKNKVNGDVKSSLIGSDVVPLHTKRPSVTSRTKQTEHVRMVHMQHVCHAEKNQKFIGKPKE